MIAVLLNAAGIVVGSLVGLVLKNHLNSTFQKTIITALGFCTFLIGIKMALPFHNIFCVIGSVVAGGAIGTALELESRVHQVGEFIQRSLGRYGAGQFATGFSVSSILFCTGAMAVVGSINAGLLGDPEVLYTKTVLDSIIAISFASVYGVGVAFSALSVLAYQGSIALLSSQLDFLTTPEASSDISGVGGILVMMIAGNLTQWNKVAVGDFLPAILIVIVYHAIIGH